MALSINTNISSLTAQRAIADSKNDLETAMERLATGSKINSASDDAAGLAMTQRMTAQIQGLNMAIKNSKSAFEVPVKYYGRTYEEGKKIRPKDIFPVFFSDFFQTF